MSNLSFKSAQNLRPSTHMENGIKERSSNYALPSGSSERFKRHDREAIVLCGWMDGWMDGWMGGL